MDKLIQRSTSITVGMVAAFAATVSYVHIRDLALANGYDPVTASIAPLSVDGLILGSSLLLIAANRHRLDAPVAKITLWLGIVATLAANVTYGLPHGVVGALVNTWPAVAFIAVVEAVMNLAKQKRRRVKRAEPSVKPTVKSPVVTQNGHKSASSGKVPGIKAIGRELHVGQPTAYEIQALMREHNVDMYKAQIIRNEMRATNAS